MFICIIDTDNDNGAAIQAVLQGVFGTDPLPAYVVPPGVTWTADGVPTGFTPAADGQSARSITGDVATAGVEAVAWAEKVAHAGDEWTPVAAGLGGIEPRQGIDPTDRLISALRPPIQTPDGSWLLPLDLGNGQFVYAPQSAVPSPVETFEPVDVSPNPSPPPFSPYTVAPPYSVDPTDNLIPQNGFDQFQFQSPPVPQYAPPVPQEPSSTELQMWAAQARAEAGARFQAEQFAAMRAAGVTPQDPTPDFTGFPQTPEVQFQAGPNGQIQPMLSPSYNPQRPTPNI